MPENEQSNSSDNGVKPSTHWEREVIEKLAYAALDEQRKTRRWGIFFKSLLFLYLLLILGAAMAPVAERYGAGSGNHTAMIDIVGTIMPNSDTNAESIINGLRAAIENKGTKGLILRMNTPGGSPVQAAYVYDEIRRIKKEKPDLPIYAVISDVCASGGYYIAAAADKIFVNQSSLIGSIGVIMNGFGFEDTMRKLGIERRLMIAGEHKAIMDPFSPLNDEEKNHVQVLLNQVHQQFITAVREGRGERLRSDPDIFSGLIWTGEEGIDIGLADGLGSADFVAREEIGHREIVNFTQQENLLDRLAGRVGTALGQVFWNTVSIPGGLLQ